MAIVTTAIGQDFEAALNQVAEDKEWRTKEMLFEEYKQRRQDRWESAIAYRRELNRYKVHRYWTAIQVPISVMGVPMIQQGWVRYPIKVVVRPVYDEEYSK